MIIRPCDEKHIEIATVQAPRNDRHVAMTRAIIGEDGTW